MASSLPTSSPSLSPTALDRGETQLWTGAPRQGFVLRSSDAFLIPFSIFWAGFAVFWEVSALRNPGPALFAIFGVPFVLAGIHITIGRFFVDARRRRRTSYVLTSERVIIRRGSTTTSLPLRTLTDVTIAERANGSGTITFGATDLRSALYSDLSWPGVQRVPAFELIPDVQRVYRLLREAQDATRRVPN